MTESGLATFRIEKERWARFQQLAKDSNSNASKLIISFIDACLDNRIDIDDYTITQPKSAISTSGIDDYLDNHLDTRIDSYLEKNLNSYLDNRIDELPIRELIRASVETALDPIREAVSKLQAVASRAVVPTDSIAKTTTKARKTKPTQGKYPDWVTKDDKPFYNKLVDNPELLDKVAEAIAIAPNSTALAESLVGLGFHKQDGTPLASTPVSRIKKVVRELKANPESTLPLSLTND